MPVAGITASAANRKPKVDKTGGYYVPDYMRTNKLPARATAPRVTPRAADTEAASRYTVGDTRKWPANDDTAEFPVYFKKYKLKATSRHGEFWVAKNIAFPEGDCRNDDASRLRVTKKQARYFLRQFERKIYPRESRWFSKPPKRNGENASEFVANEFLGLDFRKNYWKGPGRRVVMLVDNVRDDNYYDTDNANTLSRVAGFYWGLLTEEVDRNVMTIDSFNWKGGTKANPPHSPSTDPCLNFPASPYLYEGVFAHEYEHLLEYYADPDGETAWMDEGMADWAQTLTGYVQPWQPLDSVMYDSHIQCFLGYLEYPAEYNPIPAENCGAENSLTWWGDQTDDEIEILADYGAAYSFMEMLVDRYGKKAMRFLHNEPSDGFDALEKLLAEEASSASAFDTVHDWLLVMAVDKLLDQGAVLNGSDSDLQVKTLNAQVDWLNDDSYMTPGAPPNGGDYILARKNDQQQLGASEIKSITFDGANTLPPDPVEWAIDPEARAGNPALFSGAATATDRAIVENVTVPATNATLTFDTQYAIEHNWDFGFVQVSTDGGENWTSLSNSNTTSQIDPQGFPTIKEELPGFTGFSGGGDEPAWVTESFDLSAYAGKEILLSFRLMTDSFYEEPGWWIDNVTVGGTLISDGRDILEWQSGTEINPHDVHGFTVQLVSWTQDGNNVWVSKLPLGPGFAATLDGAALEAAIGTSAQNVGIIVTYDEPTEAIFDYAPYTLSVNNFEQPGGQ